MSRLLSILHVSGGTTLPRDLAALVAVTLFLASALVWFAFATRRL